MSAKLNGFLSKISFKNITLGTRINIVIFSAVIVSLIFTSLIGLHLQKKSLLQAEFGKLEIIGKTKAEQLNKGFLDFKQNVQTAIGSEDFTSIVSDLKSAYYSYEADCYEAFYSDSLKILKKLLSEYYAVEILPEFKYNSPTLNDILPDTKLGTVLQTRYLLENQTPTGEKHKFLQANDGSTYSSRHKLSQNALRLMASNLGASDLYLVDHVKGDVFYSMNKDLVFGSNLYSGKYNLSAIGKVFKEAAASTSEKFTSVSDFSFFLGNYNKQVMFVSFPLMVYGEKTAILVLQLDNRFFEKLVYDNWFKTETGSIDFNLIGSDLWLRSNPKEYNKNPENYLADLSKKSAYRLDAEQIELSGSTILISKMPDDFKLVGSEKVQVLKDYAGEKSLFSIQKINELNLNWYLISKINAEEALSSLSKLRLIILLIVFVIIISLVIIVKKLKVSIVDRLHKLRDSLKLLSQGQESDSIELGYKDELSETINTFNKLRTRIYHAIDFSNELADGNFKIKFNVENDHDALGKSLNSLKEKLQQNNNEQIQRAEKDKIQNWLNNGIAKFNDLLRLSNDNINNLSYLIIEELVAYLEANQGGIFLVEGNTTKDMHIELSAGYAYDRRKYLTKTIEIGEGLIGTCYIEKMPIFLKNIPEDYLEITSGLGGASPRNLFITPLILDDSVLGLIEVASFNTFEEHHIEFIKRVSSNIAATFKAVKLNTRTIELLEESKKRTNEIAQQEEEMRQNLEEMQATQEELARLREEDEKRTKDLQQKIYLSKKSMQSLLNAMSGEILIKDDHGIILYANLATAKRFGIALESIAGKSDFDLLSEEDIKKENNSDLDTLKSGELSLNDTLEINGERINFSITKKMIYLDELGRNGILVVRKQI